MGAKEAGNAVLGWTAASQQHLYSVGGESESLMNHLLCFPHSNIMPSASSIGDHRLGRDVSVFPVLSGLNIAVGGSHTRRMCIYI